MVVFPECILGGELVFFFGALPPPALRDSKLQKPATNSMRKIVKLAGHILAFNSLTSFEYCISSYSFLFPHLVRKLFKFLLHKGKLNEETI